MHYLILDPKAVLHLLTSGIRILHTVNLRPLLHAAILHPHPACCYHASLSTQALFCILVLHAAFLQPRPAGCYLSCILIIQALFCIHIVHAFISASLLCMLLLWILILDAVILHRASKYRWKSSLCESWTLVLYKSFAELRFMPMLRPVFPFHPIYWLGLPLKSCIFYYKEYIIYRTEVYQRCSIQFWKKKNIGCGWTFLAAWYQMMACIRHFQVCQAVVLL